MNAFSNPKPEGRNPKEIRRPKTEAGIGQDMPPASGVAIGSVDFTHSQSRRDCGIEHRVARNELPWVMHVEPDQPQRGCGARGGYPTNRKNGSTPQLGRTFPPRGSLRCFGFRISTFFRPSDFCLRIFQGACAGALLIVLASGCKPANSPSATKASAPPAKVITENDLATITLRPEAEQRLGITTAPLEVKKVGRSRTLGGELLLPLGRAESSSNSAPASSKSIYSLLPAMTPAELVRVGEMQIDADGQIAAARVELEAAKIALQRAQNLVASSAGTQRGVDDARARVQLAEAALHTARERRALLGAPLFDAVRKDVLWVRVSVYAGDLNQVNRSAPASVSSLGGSRNEPARAARPVAVPFSSAAAPATVDLFYEVDNADGNLRPGEKVIVAVPLQGETESSVVPAAAVLYDIHGGTWVYENTAPQTFTRRRVEVRFVSKGDAVLARGPKPGVKVVTAGAAELFGTEFGIGK